VLFERRQPRLGPQFAERHGHVLVRADLLSGEKSSSAHRRASLYARRSHRIFVPRGLFGLRLDAAPSRALGLTRLRRDALFFFFSFGRGPLEGGGRSSPPPPADAPQRNRAGLGERLRKS
jgi:hypothetical protein